MVKVPAMQWERHMDGNMQGKETSGIWKERGGHARKTKSGMVKRMRIVYGGPHPSHHPQVQMEVPMP